MSRSMGNVRLYIDGFNLYHAIENIGIPYLKWLNFWRVGENLLRQDEALEEVHFFTAVWPYEKSKQLRHRNFIAAQLANGVNVHEGKFSKPRRWCERHQRSCPFREEKQTDVGIAVKMLMDAHTAQLSRMIIVTADSDQIPTAKAINALGVNLTLAFPPWPLGRSERAWKSHP